MTKAILDGNSMYLASRKMSISIDYRKLKQWLEDHFGCTKVVLCCTVDDSERFRAVLQVLEHARKLGYEVFLRNTRGHNLSASAQIAAELAESYTRDEDVVLWYGGGDMRPIVDRALSKGVRVTLVSHPGAMSGALSSLVGGFVDIQDFSENIRRSSKSY